MFNLTDHCLAPNLARWPEKPALVLLDGDGGERVWSFAAFADAAARRAAALASLGLGRGDRVLLRLDNGSEAALLVFAAIAAGLVPVTCSPLLTRRELAAIALASGARLLVQVDEARGEADGVLPPLVLHPREIEALARRLEPAAVAATAAEDPAFLLFTSGTSGQPKGVLHAQRTVLGRRPMRLGWQGFGPSDRAMHAGRLNWTYTLGVGLMDPWAAGATAVLVTDPPDPGRWPELIARHRVTVFAAVPTVFRQILKYGDPQRLRGSALRHALSAGEALPAELYSAWTAATGRPLYEALGMSEISTYISSGPSTPVRPGSPGRAQPGRRIAILRQEGGSEPLPPGETGLLAVHRSDPGLMLGYWGDEEGSAAAFRGPWFVGGDRALIDPDGYVWFGGRADDVLNCQGFRVSALEVERVLAGHPGVAEVAVGVTRRADAVELMTAFVVPAAGELDGQALLGWAADRLAAYKRPKLVRPVAALPRTPNGKLIRARLAALTGDGSG